MEVIDRIINVAVFVGTPLVIFLIVFTPAMIKEHKQEQEKYKALYQDYLKYANETVKTCDYKQWKKEFKKVMKENKEK